MRRRLTRRERGRTYDRPIERRADQLAADASRARRRARTVVIVGALVVLALLLRRTVPPVVIADAGHDDALFIRQARAILDGKWLGPLDDKTLSKGPGYAIYLALAHRAHVGAKLGEQLVQVVAAALVALGLAGLTRRRTLSLVIFGALCLNPAYLGQDAARFNRIGFYGSVCTALVGAVLVAGSTLGTPSRRGRATKAALATVALALTSAAYALTREERVWLLPTLATLVAAFGRTPTAARPAGDSGHYRKAWRALASWFAPLAAVLVVTIGLAGVVDRKVRSLNTLHYGMAVVTDADEGSIPRLLRALTAIDEGAGRPYVSITRLQRTAAAGVSSTFADLDTLVEDERRWIDASCAVVQVCDDFAGGWFPWALREALWTRTGFEGDERRVQALAAQAAGDIEAACGVAYRCSTPIADQLPLGRLPLGGILRSVWRGTTTLTRFGTAPVQPAGGAEDSWALFHSVARDAEPDAARQQQLIDSRRQPAGAALRGLYGVALALLAVPALVGLARRARDERDRIMRWIGIAALVGVASRIGLLAVIDATAFPAATPGYLLPAYDLAIVAVLVGCARLGPATGWSRSWRAPRRRG